MTTPLTFNDYNNRYYATIDTSTIPYGPHTLTFTAYDKLGRTSTRQYTVHKYAPPRVWVTNPRANRTLTGDTRIAATCVGTPPYSCTQFKARVRSQVRDEVLMGVKTSPGRMHVLHDLSSPLQSGEVLTIRLEATDDVGPVWYGPTIGGGLGFYDWALPRVYVERSPKLTAVQRAPGAIVDFDATRVLFMDHVLQIGLVDRMTQQVTWLGELRPHPDWMHKPGYAALTPTGAALQAWYGSVFLWKDNMLDRTHRRPARLDAVNGDTLLWTRADDDEAIVHTLSTGIETSLWLDPGSASPFQADITASGDIYYSTHEEPWIRGPGEIRLGNHPGYLQRPITDGTNVAGRWWNGSVSSSYLYTADGAEVFLGDSRTGDAAGLLLHAGHAAYLKSDGAVNQVWLRTPSGDEYQLSNFATPSQFDQQELRIGHDGISGTGEVMFLNNKKRYIGRPGAAPEEISSDLGHGRWFDGDWHVAIGDTLFKVTSAEAPAFLGASPAEAPAFLGASPGEAAPVNAEDEEQHDLTLTALAPGEPLNPWTRAGDLHMPGASPASFRDPRAATHTDTDAPDEEPSAAAACSIGQAACSGRGVALLSAALVGLSLSRRRRHRQPEQATDRLVDDPGRHLIPEGDGARRPSKPGPAEAGLQRDTQRGEEQGSHEGMIAQVASPGQGDARSREAADGSRAGV
ncbi:hypothetical protein WME89_13030 [Sorangium sp. So ce321]|uniref:hypothetical protein n=1 Tax=Sorangium sp. So ce321 TaxID=3133300 RepID=UPI003F616365